MSSQTFPNEREKTLSAKQRAAIPLLASGQTIAKTAKALNLSEKTIDNYKRLPEFMDALHLAEDELYNDSMALLKRTARAAVMTLISCLDSANSGYVRVSSASKLLDASMEVHSFKVLEARIAELESLTRGEE